MAGPWALRWVRLVSSLLFSLLAAFGVAFLQGEKTPWGGPLALATITPTTLAFAGLVQPQSLEVGASIALAGLVMPLAVYKDEIRLRLLLGIPVAGLLILSRTTGPWWALTICLLALAIYPRSFFPAFFRSPSLWRFVGCAAFFCIVSLGWGFATNDWYEFHSVRATEGACGIFACILPQGTNWVRLVEATAIAGWLNPVGALHRLYLYWAFLAVLFLSACLSQPLKAFLGLAFAAAAYVLSVVLLSVSWVDAYGAPIWQGRYALPLFTGLFIALATISGTGIESGRRLPRALPQWVGRFGAAAQGILILDLALVAAVRFWIGLSQGYYSLLLAADTPLASRVGLIAVFAGVAGLAFIAWHRPRPQSAGIEEQPTQTTTPDSTDQTS